MTSRSTKKTSARTYGGLSEAERVVERRERLLDAGLEVFGTVGIRGATVRALCKAAGLTERYFYESFADTDTLFCAVYEKQTIEWQNYFLTRLPQLPPDLEGRIHTALHLYFDLMRNERLVRVLYIEGMAGSTQVNLMYHAARRREAETVAQLIRIDNPGVSATDEMLVQVALALNGATTAIAVQWMMGSYQTSQDLIVASCERMVRGIMRELLQSPAAG